MFGETVSVAMLFIPNHEANASGIRKTSQTNPALWIQVSVPASIVPIRVPDDVSRIFEPPPKMPVVITNGIRICMVVTPALPRPAFRPRARPCIRFG